jgi:hypothetical protein
MRLIDESPGDETRVREALRRATDELSAPVHRLTATATFGGRRLRRRRRIGTVVATVCAVTAVAVPVGIVLGGSGETADGSIATDPTPTAETAPPAPTPHSVPSPADEARWTQMPATRMLAVLEGLTADDVTYADAVVTNEDRAPGEREHVMHGYLLADVVANGSTAGGINLVLMGPEEPTSRYTCPGNLISPDSCTELTDESGATVGRRSRSTTGGVTVLEVVLRGPDGGLVYVAASNSADDKWGAGSAIASGTVPLTMEQLEAIAASPVWTDWEPPGRSQQ